MRYRIDPGESRVWIEARSSLHPIHSESSGIHGWLDAVLDPSGRIDDARPVTGHVELPMEKLSCGNRLYDREMLRRVDARRYPSIVGELVEMKGTGTEGRYHVQGDVTFRGETRPVADEMTLSARDGATIVLEGSHTFDVRDFGMEPPKILTLRVYPDVTVRVSLVASREGEGDA